MKLDKLWIEDFKNLKDFSIDFDEKSSVTVVIGWNGTGKSNLFEALAIIFRDLDLERPTLFAYRIEYICYGNTVKIDNDPKRPARERLKKEVTPLDPHAQRHDDKGELPHLPSYVFGYYSGPTHRLREHFLEHQRIYYNNLLSQKVVNEGALKQLQSLRRFFFAEDQHSKYVALAFFLKKDEKIEAFLREYMRIIGLESVLFIMKKPSWTSKEGDPRFWNARGLVQKFLDHLYSISLAPMRLTQNIPTGIAYRAKREFLYLFVKDAETLSTFAHDYDSPSEFFASLESTDLSEVIDDVRINVRILNHDGTLTFRELSEGEQQLLMVLGLLRFTKQQESLILLDEPDTHLNPYWSTEYLELLTKIVDDDPNPSKGPEQETRHIIMSTHDPLVIAGLEKQQIQIMKRDAETGRCYAEIPERSPKGMGFEGVLTSDMFGFRSALDKPTLKLLDEKRRLAIKDELTDDEKFALEELNELIGPLDFTNVVRDEYFNLFSRWMAEYEKREGLERLVLDPAEYAARKKHAQQLAAKLSELKQGNK
jgi:ABC-type cobalamin/Fe3+-siderophores transport system ATPase subunit